VGKFIEHKKNVKRAGRKDGNLQLFKLTHTHNNNCVTFISTSTQETEQESFLIDEAIASEGV